MSAAPDANKLRGFGLPFDHRHYGGPESIKYGHALDRGFLSYGVAVREQRMLEFMNQITDKADWQWKIHNEEIVAKWREEASRAIDVDGIEDEYLSGEMFDYCLRELRDKAAYLEKTGIVTVLDAEFYIAKSDTLVTEGLKQRLKDAVAPLENVPESQKDWHPGSDGKVLDLLHPSLFPLRYGLTRVLPTGKVPLNDCFAYIGKGKATQLLAPSQLDSADGERGYGQHQWLPSDLKWTTEGLKIASYVNNLHPHKHKDLYKVLESFATLSVPMFEQVATQERYKRTESCLSQRIDVSSTGDEDWYLPEGAVFEGYEKPLAEYTEDELEERHWEDDYQDWKESVRLLRQREPKQYSDRNKVSLHNFRELYPDGLQIIFKLANIHLKPEKPDYEGGTWHIEGTLNEQICATVLYYYDQDNITDSHLAFRHRLDQEALQQGIPQGDWASFEAYLGIKNEGPENQRLGKVLTRAGRMLAFPNIVQHQVQPFSLADKSKPGHRKILAMFLVDPNVRVLSTSVVPPQRRDWWAEELRKVPRFSRLPAELFEMQIEQVEDFPVSWEDALKIREDLIKERSVIVDSANALWEEAMFSFCEH